MSDVRAEQKIVCGTLDIEKRILNEYKNMSITHIIIYKNNFKL